MPIEVILPKLGQTMENGTIVEWVKQEGDPVKRGEVLFTVESDKAVLDVEAMANGFLRKILVREGQPVPVLTVVALMTRQADEPLVPYEEVPAPVPQAEPALGAAPATEPVPAATEGQTRHRIVASPRARKAARQQGVDLALLAGTGPGGRIVEQDVLSYVALRPRVTPVAANVARARGVDLAAVRGTGPGGRVTRADIEAAAEAPSAPMPVPAAEALAPKAAAAVQRVAVSAPPMPAAAALPAELVPEVEAAAMTGLRRIIAERMSASHQAVARVTLVTEAEATALVAVRQQLKAAVAAEWGFVPGYSDLLGLIVARALQEFPYMNARLAADGSTIERMPVVNLGMAVDTERGLLVPVIRGAGQMHLRTLSTEFRVLAERARAGKSLPDDLAGGTFTITNLGMYDVDAFTPIVNLPEAAILGVGRIQQKPVVHDGAVVVRHMWTLSLSFDHRLVDGAPAARFLQRIKALIESPYLLL
jgi:pyruvate dehydrogenase E2 component (dihydrolipoamide acetyltransferase)